MCLTGLAINSANFGAPGCGSPPYYDWGCDSDIFVIKIFWIEFKIVIKKFKFMKLLQHDERSFLLKLLKRLN